MTQPSPAVHLFQIAYSQATLESIEPGYGVLDNLANPRPDWYEYWPVRAHLLAQQGGLDESAHYGFFSPKFGKKTLLSHAQTVQAVQAAAQAPQPADVVLFSPQPDMGAFFLNVFEQNETFDPGFLPAAQAFVAHAGLNVELKSLVMDTRHVVFSNYFVARPAFWRRWLALCEQLFAVCEGLDERVDPALRATLTAPTTYPGSVQRKVFLMERLASLLLATEPGWRTHAVNPFTMAWSASRLATRPLEAVMSDALKMAYREQGFQHYLTAFARIRDSLKAGAPA
jgi:hypothetical protein